MDRGYVLQDDLPNSSRNKNSCGKGITFQSHNHGNYKDKDQNNILVAAQLGLYEEIPTLKLERILVASTMFEWWRELRENIDKTEVSHLHWNILSFCKAYELTPRQEQLRKNALDYVERVVHEIWPSVEVHLFGSIVTGLSLPWSDIDVAVMSPKQDSYCTWQKPTTRQWLSLLSRRLDRYGKCQSLQQIPHAKVPLLKILLTSGISCDISFDVDNSSNSVSMVRHFMEQYETLRPLCLVLKFFLGQNNLNELHTGGLGSFCIINMVVSHLQKVRLNETRFHVTDLGTLLLSFFARYSNMHNYTTDVVSTRADFCGSKQTKGWMNSRYPDLLAVEDPLDPTSDIGKGSYRIREVRAKFSEAQRVLLNHWHHEHVLAQLIDTTGDPNQKPKQGINVTTGRLKKKNRRHKTGGEEEFSQPARKVQRTLQHDTGILARGPVEEEFSQPARKVQRTLQHDTGILARGPVDRILSGTGSANFSSRTNHDVPENRSETEPEDSQSLQKILQNPTPYNPGEDSELLSTSEDSMIAKSTMKRKCRESLDDRILVEFWESHLTPRLKSRKVSLQRCGPGGEHKHAQLVQKYQQDRDTYSNTQVEKLLDEFGEAHLATKRKSRNISLKHLDKDDQPVHGIHAKLPVPRQGRERETKTPDEKLLEEFWEVHLAKKRKSRNGSLQHHGTPGDDKDAQPVDGIHSEIHAPQQGRDTNPNIQDEKLLEEFWKAHLATKRKSGNGSLKQDYCTPGDDKDQPVHGMHPEQPPPERDVVENVHVEERLVDCLIGPHQESMNLSSMHDVTGRENKGVLSVQLNHPQQGSDVAGRSRERILVDIWEANLSRGLKSMQASLRHQGSRGEQNSEPVPMIHLDQPPLGSQVVGRSQDERKLHEFWETRVCPKFKSSNQHEAGRKVEDAKPLQKVAVGRRQDDHERILLDFWEEHLNPRLSRRKDF